MNIIAAIVALKDRILEKLKFRTDSLEDSLEEIYRKAYLEGYMAGVDDTVETFMVSLTEDRDSLH